MSSFMEALRSTKLDTLTLSSRLVAKSPSNHQQTQQQQLLLMTPKTKRGHINMSSLLETPKNKSPCTL